MIYDLKNEIARPDYPMDHRESAEKRKVLYHYCSLKAAERIVSTRTIRLNCVKNYGNSPTSKYEVSGIIEQHQKLVFIGSFSSEPNSKQLWADFADGKHGARIGFIKAAPFHDVVIDKSKKIRAYSEAGKLLAELGFGISSVLRPAITLNPNYFTDIVADISLTDLDYSGTNQSSILCDGIPMLDISSVSKQVEGTYMNEKEIRIVAVLRGTKSVELSEAISHLDIPLDFSKCGIEIKFGKKVSTSDKIRIEAYCK